MQVAVEAGQPRPVTAGTETGRQALDRATDDEPDSAGTRGVLTPAEIVRGWVAHCCPTHGFLVAMTINATVICSCGRRAQRTLKGKVLRERDVERLRRRRGAGAGQV